MKFDHVKHIIPDYLEGNLEERERKGVENHLEQCEECQNELAQYLELEEMFGEEKEVEPSANLGANFSAMLAREENEVPVKKDSFLLKDILKIAAAIAILFVSFQAGRFTEQNSTSSPIVVMEDSGDADKRIAMLSLMTDESASKRIQGVNYFEEVQDVDDDILKVLGNKMLYDENNNVRLAAVEALSKFSASEEVKQNLVTALKTEKDPVIQISLIQILVKIREKKAVEPMEELLQNQETESFVKDQIRALLPSIV